ncbi:5-formyltetrahydrofolate cyclo-ligase [Methanobacterium sp.]|uniref:5-formyltetrahydrofolate cyclo-ligase n=1 Tax=Methanobacterium sp. TaxID=2164 RepID=UPI003C73930E
MIIKEKERLRNLIWSTLENNDLFEHANLEQPPKSPYGRIPNFVGSTEAARMLKNTEEWQKSEVVFSSPDSAQKKVREFALFDKKVLIMASPKLKDGFLLIDPYSVVGNEETASTIDGAFKFGKKLHEFPQIDLVVEGSVAVDKSGNRLGKGGGYGDREISELLSEKTITTSTPVVTTIHEVQIIDNVPTEEHDQKINMIVTPQRVIRIN